MQSAVERIYGEEISLQQLRMYGKTSSVGHRNGVLVSKQIQDSNLRQHKSKHTHQQNRQKEVIRENDTKKWKRILSTTAAAKESDCSIDLLASRDVAIMNRETTSKYRNRKHPIMSIGE